VDGTGTPVGNVVFNGFQTRRVPPGITLKNHLYIYLFIQETTTKHVAMNIVTALFEVPEVLEEGHLGGFLDLKLGTYISTRLLKPNPVELEDLDSRDIASQYFKKLIILLELHYKPLAFISSKQQSS
jgi:hypothetical protein